MAHVTVREITAAKAKSKPYKITVERGLYIRVATNGEKRWLVKYVIDGKQKEARLPQPFGSGGAGYLSLADATAENAYIQSLARKNIDFQVLEQEERAKQKKLKEDQIENDLTFGDLFDVWIKDGVRRADDNAYLIWSFSKHAFPTLKNIKVNALTEHELISIYRKLVAGDKCATALELSKDIKQMLSWAEKRKPWRRLLIDGNPADLVNIRNILPHNYTKRRDRVLSFDEIINLKQKLDEMSENYLQADNKNFTRKPLKTETQIAIWICLGTLCRIGELSKARWQNVDFDKRVWSIPAEDTKGESGKKQAQTVYLSDFVLSQFKKLQGLTGNSKWLFPSQNNDSHVCEKSASKQIGDRQIKFKNRTRKLTNRAEDDSLVIGDEKWTMHDLRRTGATLMQKLKIPRDIINLCQNHVVGSQVDRHYLHYDYFDEKKEAWNQLGHYLSNILNSNKSDKVVYFQRT